MGHTLLKYSSVPFNGDMLHERLSKYTEGVVSPVVAVVVVIVVTLIVAGAVVAGPAEPVVFSLVSPALAVVTVAAGCLVVGAGFSVDDDVLMVYVVKRGTTSTFV